MPSLFDVAHKRRQRQPLIFLGAFASAVSEPFERDDRIHIEYVPTQIVTEWLRARFDPGSSVPLDAVATVRRVDPAASTSRSSPTVPALATWTKSETTRCSNSSRPAEFHRELVGAGSSLRDAVSRKSM